MSHRHALDPYRDKADLRHHGIIAVRIKGELLHPECRTTPEMLLRVPEIRFEHEVIQVGLFKVLCPRCWKDITERPEL